MEAIEIGQSSDAFDHSGIQTDRNRESMARETCPTILMITPSPAVEHSVGRFVARSDEPLMCRTLDGESPEALTIRDFGRPA